MSKHNIDLKNLKFELQSDESKSGIRRFLWHLAIALILVILASRLAPERVEDALDLITSKAREAKEKWERKLGKFARRFIDFIIDWAEYITVSGLRLLRRILFASGLALMLLCGSLVLPAPELTGILTFAIGVIVMVAVAALQLAPERLFGGEAGKQKFIESVKLVGLWPIAIALALIMLPHAPFGGTFVLCLLLLAAFFIIYGPLNWAKRLATWLVYSSLLFQVISGGVSLAHKGTFGGHAKDWFTSAKHEDIYHQKKGEAQDKENKLYEEHTYAVVRQTSPIALFEVQAGRKDSVLILNARKDTISEAEEVETFSPEQIRSTGVEMGDALLQQLADTVWHYPAKAKLAFGYTEDVTLVTYKDQGKRQSFSDGHRIFVFYVPSSVLRIDPTITPMVSGTRTESAQRVSSASYPLSSMSKGAQLSASIPIADLQAKPVPGSDSSWIVDVPATIGISAIRGVEAPAGSTLRFTFESSTVQVNYRGDKPDSAKWFTYAGDPCPWGFQSNDWFDDGLAKSGSVTILETGKFGAPLVDTDGQFSQMFSSPNMSQTHTIGDLARKPIYLAWNDIWVQRWTDNYKLYPGAKFLEYRAIHRKGVMKITITLQSPRNGNYNKLVARSGGQ